MLSFLLRHGLVSPYGHWTKMHRRWLRELVFAHPAQHLSHESSRSDVPAVSTSYLVRLGQRG
jgi:hypothetical protein